MPRCPRCHRRLDTAARCPVDGNIAPAVPTPRRAALPAIVGGYRIGAAIGIGGFSTVLEGVNDRTGACAAIKLARGSSHDVTARFAREADALALVGSPHVPELIGQGALDDGRPFLVMEYVHGQTLAQLLGRAEQLLPIADVIELAARILDSLHAVHAKVLVHRDLKPENVVVPDRCPARLVDFGLVSGAGVRADVSLTRVGTLVGTWEYMAPEQIRGTAVTAATDVYNIGLLLFELLALRLPFTGDRASLEHGHLALRPPSPSLFRPVPTALERLVLACLAKSPEARPTAAALRADLAALDGDAIAPAATSASPARRDGDVNPQRPVALVYANGNLPIHAIQRLAADHRAVIARSRGAELVFALLGSDHDRPVEAALALARDAVAHPSTRAAVHVGRAVVRQSTRGNTSLYGRDLEHVNTWLPPKPWQGVVLSTSAASSLGLAPSDVEDAFLPAPADDVRARAATLVGRDAETAQALAAVERAFAKRATTVCVIAGEEGVGTSSVGEHACDRVANAYPDAEVLRLACRRPLAGDIEQRSPILRALGIEGFGDEAVPAAIDELARRAQRGLVVFVDDVHFADDLTLQIIERSSSDLPMCWMLTCKPRFLDSRKRYAADPIVLAPLDADITATLATQLLPAGTTVSREALLKLAQWTGGNPSLLRDLIDMLRRETILRRHEGTNAWFVASDELARLPASPAIEWLAARELESLAPAVADCAWICAAIGPEITAEELEAALRALEREDADRRLVDASVGLGELTQHTILVERATGYAFRRGSLQEGLYALCPEPMRRAVHEAVYQRWAAVDSPGTNRLARMAHHGARSGHRDEARACYVELAARAKARHAYAESERMLTAALALCAADDSLRFRLLAERGALRRMLTRYEDARGDVVAARALAEAAHDRVGVVSVLVEEAAICDFTDQWDVQAELVARAAELAAGGLPAHVDARLRNWLGVTRARQGKLDEAIELLDDAAALGAALGEHETEVGSLTLLGFLLVSRGERVRGKTILDRAIATCEARADAYHLAIGLLNRITYWDKEGPWDRAEQDCARAVAIAHEMGFHQLAIYGLQSLSIGRWWRGDGGGALEAARKAYELSIERFGTNSGHSGRVQYAYLLAFDGRIAEARELLRHIREEEIRENPANRAYVRALHLAVDGGSEADWQETLAQTREHCERRDFIEVLWLRARSAARLGQRAAAVAALELAHAEAQQCEAPIAPILLAEQRALAA